MGQQLAPSGAKARITANLAAIRTAAVVTDQGRPATPDEQLVLARWSSWGAVPSIFDETRDEHAAARAELRGLLTDQEYQASRRSTVNAHYTDPAYVSAIWNALQDLGFDGGRVLEPGCGSGTFIGLAPAGALMTGIELDPVTARIAAALYPQSDIHGSPRPVTEQGSSTRPSATCRSPRCACTTPGTTPDTMPCTTTSSSNRWS